jgi:hypothetical protein
MHTPTNMPIMPFVILILLLLPFRLGKPHMKSLAFALWLIGGFVLGVRGVLFLLSVANPNALVMALAILAALAIGFGKGKFVLSKTSQRNIDRIEQFTEPKRPIQVYSLRSWIIIGLMVGISVSLTVLQTPLFWRGAVNLAIGFALVISSLAYLRALSPRALSPVEQSSSEIN